MTARPGDRRPRIVAAALRLVAREGPALVTTRKIAREAAVNLATLHYFFRSKDALLGEVLAEATDLMIAALGEPETRPGLAERAEALLVLVDGDPALPLVRCELHLYLSRLPDQANAAHEERERYLAALERLHDGACPEAGRAGCGRAIAELLVGIVDGLAVQRAGLEVPQAARRTREGAVRLIRVLLVEHGQVTAPTANGSGVSAGWWNDQPDRLTIRSAMPEPSRET